MKSLQVLIIVIACLVSSSRTRHNPLFNVNGKVALITGGLGGIGKAYARELLRNGCKGISLVDIDSDEAAEIIEDLDSEFRSGCAIFIEADVTNSTALEESFVKTVKHFEQLDIVINNAGIADEAAQNGKLLLDINLVAVEVGTALAFKKYLPRYMEGPEGVIINTAALAGLIPNPVLPTYSAAASGIIALGRTMGQKYFYDQHKIKILTLVPGNTNTPFFEDVLSNLPFEHEVNSKIICTLQEPEVVGKALIRMLKNGRTGTVWAINNNKLKKIDFRKVDRIMMNQIFTQ